MKVNDEGTGVDIYLFFPSSLFPLLSEKRTGGVAFGNTFLFVCFLRGEEGIFVVVFLRVYYSFVLTLCFLFIYFF